MNGASGHQGGFGPWVIVFVLMCAQIFSFTDRFALSLLIQPIKADLALTDGELGLLSGVAFGLFYAVMGLPLGWLADRWSRKGTILIGVGVWSAATAACGFANSFMQLLAARTLVGAGEAGLSPASFSLITALFPRRILGRAISVFQLGTVVGAGTALLVGGQIYSLLVAGAGAGWPIIGEMKPWQQTFVILAMPGPLFILLIYLIREPRKTSDPVPTATKSGSLIFALRLQPKLYMLLFLGMAGIVLVNYAMLSWTPAIFVREFGWTVGDFGSVYGKIVAISSSIALIAGGTLADYLYRHNYAIAHRLIAIVAACLGMPGMIVFLMTDNATYALLAIGYLHFSLTLPIGVSPAFLQLCTPQRARGQMSALYTLVVNVAGLGFGPVAVGYLSDLWGNPVSGLRTAMGITCIVTMAVSVLALTLLLREKVLSADD